MGLASVLATALLHTFGIGLGLWLGTLADVRVRRITQVRWHCDGLRGDRHPPGVIWYQLQAAGRAWLVDRGRYPTDG